MHGFINSSSRISPGWVGGIFLACFIIKCLASDNPRHTHTFFATHYELDDIAKAIIDNEHPRSIKTRFIMKILVTGCAGFIGAKVAHFLLDEGMDVIGIDNLNDYYDVNLKKARLLDLETHPHFSFVQQDIANSLEILHFFAKHKFHRVIHLAAQAGVRYSLHNPHAYVDSNLQGFVNILEGCRHNGVEHLVFASSSSVYGANTQYPFSESDRTDHPISLYAATKKANEMLAHSYSHLYQLPTTGLRYFTVYGPWGRPDMAPMQFAKAICAHQPIQVHNQGQHQRDFTFIDDIARGTIQAMHHVAKSNPVWCGETPDTPTSSAPYRIYNIGYGEPAHLLDFIALLEEALGIKAIMDFQPKQPGDVEITYADTQAFEAEIGYRARVSLEEGIVLFAEWFKKHQAV
jgi:UDP-glucuronate 4-epimerase